MKNLIYEIEELLSLCQYKLENINALVEEQVEQYESSKNEISQIIKRDQINKYKIRIFSNDLIDVLDCIEKIQRVINNNIK